MWANNDNYEFDPKYPVCTDTIILCIYKCELIAFKKQKQINQGCNNNWEAWQIKSVSYLGLSRRKNNDCVDKDANKFLLHQWIVWYILNDRINYIFYLTCIQPPRRIKFFEKHNPFNELAYLTSRQNREVSSDEPK